MQIAAQNRQLANIIKKLIEERNDLLQNNVTHFIFSNISLKFYYKYCL